MVEQSFEVVMVMVMRSEGKRLTTEFTEFTETNTEDDRNAGCPGFGSLLVNFGMAVAVADVAGVARDSCCGSRPKVLASVWTVDNQEVSEQMAFQKSHEKGKRNARRKVSQIPGTELSRKA